MGLIIFTKKVCFFAQSKITVPELSQSLVTNQSLRQLRNGNFTLSKETDLLCENYEEITWGSNKRIEKKKKVDTTLCTPIKQPAVEMIPQANPECAKEKTGKIMRPVITHSTPKVGRQRKCKKKLMEERVEIDKITGETIKRKKS